MFRSHLDPPDRHTVAPAPARTRFLRRALAGMLAPLAIASISLVFGTTPAHADPNLNASEFKGVNWARVGDNFYDGPLVLQGMDASDSYDTIKAKSAAIYTGLQNNLGANTVRLPINTDTVSSTWWNSYRGAIDAATDKGFKVVLAYWEGDGSDHPARVAMWDAVIAKYGSNPQVYFEPWNEPGGTDSWLPGVAAWIDRYSSLPRHRIFVSGASLNTDIESICSDRRFDGTYVSWHSYTFFHSGITTYKGWLHHIADKLNSCDPSRVVLDEFGETMMDGSKPQFNYNDANTTENRVQYLRAHTEAIRTLGIGSIYWPALGGKFSMWPDNPPSNPDGYALQALHGSGTDLTLSNVNDSGVDRIKYGWGLASDPTATSTSALFNIATKGCLDVPALTDKIGTQVGTWDCNGGDNQKWTRTETGQITVYSGDKKRCLDVLSERTDEGSKVAIWNCNGHDNQKWTVDSHGTIRGVQSNRCLRVDPSTSKVELGALGDCTANNQKWLNGQ
jgi:hypothetical protein